jgi:uncharacterized protein DUF6916
MDEPLTHEHFAPHVGKHIGIEGYGVPLLLASVDVQPRFAAPDATRVPFTLTFEGPAHDTLPAGHYLAAIADGPVWKLHISPIHTQSRDRQDYQAVFN